MPVAFINFSYEQTFLPVCFSAHTLPKLRQLFNYGDWIVYLVTSWKNGHWLKSTRRGDEKYSFLSNVRTVC